MNGKPANQAKYLFAGFSIFISTILLYHYIKEIPLDFSNWSKKEQDCPIQE